MVKKPRELFKCLECGLFFDNKDLAKKCEKFCRKFKACNVELIKKSVK